MSMKILTIVIVNYNVRYFLEQCLRSVALAGERLENKYGPDCWDVYVVDNRSVDGSVEMVRQLFPWVKCIANTENVGFSRANNQAMRLSNAKYQLLLNPDTLLEEDTLVSVVDFMETHPEAGGLGVKMVDGKGRFLPESKRGLPTPWVAFFKVFGFSALFPKSKWFGRYHLGYLSEDEIHEVDVLSGAFMLLRKEALDKVGMLDETYFMYGEDVDLSYRIQKGGYKNYYFPGTRIIHYKGESTKKGSLNYVFVFYRAMEIFARQHFRNNNAAFFSALINMAIWGRAGLAIAKRAFQQLALPALDLFVMFGLFQFIRIYWERNHIYLAGGAYPDFFTWVMLPAVCLILGLTLSLNGSYRRPYINLPVWRGMTLGAAAVLVIYSLLPEEHRYSRAVLLLGIAFSALCMVGIRTLLRMCGIRAFQPVSPHPKRVLIVGSKSESDAVRQLLALSGKPADVQGVVSPGKNREESLGSLDELAMIARVLDTEEIIFCQNDIGSAEIISQMSRPEWRDQEFKIASPGARIIIGSQSIQRTGEWYAMEEFKLQRPALQNAKRRFDLIVCLLGFLPFLLLWPFMHRPRGFWKNWLDVFSGLKTWVGYSLPADAALPALKPAVLEQAQVLGGEVELNPTLIHHINCRYAREYHTGLDFEMLRKGWRWLGNTGKQQGNG